MFYLWTLYLDALQSYPLLTKCCTSLVGFIVGDTIAQLLTRDHRFNGLRTLRFAIIGFFLHAPVVSAWITVLDSVRALLSWPFQTRCPTCCAIRQCSDAPCACRLSTQRRPPGE